MNPASRLRSFIALPAAIVSIGLGHAAEPLSKLENCTFVPADWADGDSFQIKTATGDAHTVRLYGVDCLEWHVHTDSDSRRLSTQRRYFGITAAAPTVAKSIELAKDFGKAAGEKTAALLAKPFTVHTRFSDARGDGRHKRIYGFVTCADGSDLAATLVKAGLARAYGVDAQTPDGKSAKESAAALADLELQAAKRGVGIWARTDWDKLPVERFQQRQEDEETDLAIAKRPLPAGFKLDPNTAARDDLMKLSGIGEVMANRIITGRPYQKLSDLLEVDGIGPETLKKLAPHLIFPAAGK
jgi:competence protein ComEA